MRNDKRKGRAMMIQLTQRMEMDKLSKRREVLRRKLKKHFLLPVQERNYNDFEEVVDELDSVRKKIHEIKFNPQS
jgi:hypothetical protein